MIESDSSFYSWLENNELCTQGSTFGEIDRLL